VVGGGLGGGSCGTSGAASDGIGTGSLLAPGGQRSDMPHGELV